MRHSVKSSRWVPSNLRLLRIRSASTTIQARFLSFRPFVFVSSFSVSVSVLCVCFSVSVSVSVSDIFVVYVANSVFFVVLSSFFFTIRSTSHSHFPSISLARHFSLAVPPSPSLPISLPHGPAPSPFPFTGARVINSNGQMSIPDSAHLQVDGGLAAGGSRPGPDMYGRYAATHHMAEAGGVYSRG